MFRLDYLSGKLIMRIIQVLCLSYPQIKGLSQIIQEFFICFFAVILKQSVQSAEKCMKE